jgi:hypothetical protein
MIQSTSNIPGFYRADALSSSLGQKTPATQTQAETNDSLSSASTQGLRDALAQTAEIRPEVVQRGKSLAVDPNYPPRELIESLAELMTNSRDLTVAS